MIWALSSQLLKNFRKRTPYSQRDISHLLGYKNGQFISNVERGLCGVPVQKVQEYCRLIKLDVNTYKDALIEDFAKGLELDLSEFPATGTDSSPDQLDMFELRREEPGLCVYYSPGGSVVVPGRLRPEVPEPDSPPGPRGEM